ncbi:hypothetical protein BDR04DRAFT_1093130 [Suillus decipiens]|nr:hypothetical protein BDR04DRAFT_1093130 [Suillus decipiens]
MPVAALAGRPVSSLNFNCGEKVDNLMSNASSTQSPKRCNLSVDTFEALAKIQMNLRYHTQQKVVANGTATRRHAHMHTGAQPGINVDVAADLEAIFAWAPLAPRTQNVDDDLAVPESISLDKIDVAFSLLEHEKDTMERVLIDGLDEVLEVKFMTLRSWSMLTEVFYRNLLMTRSW